MIGRVFVVVVSFAYFVYSFVFIVYVYDCGIYEIAKFESIIDDLLFFFFFLLLLLLKNR